MKNAFMNFTCDVANPPTLETAADPPAVYYTTVHEVASAHEAKASQRMDDVNKVVRVFRTLNSLWNRKS